MASPVLRTLLVLMAMVATACIQSVARGGASGAPNGSGGSSIEASASIPQPSGPTPAPTFLLYVVKRGDNLNTIAHRFGTSGRSIAYWNRGTYPSLDPEASGYSPNLVKVGWTLILIPKVILDEQTLEQPAPDSTDQAETEPAAS